MSQLNFINKVYIENCHQSFIDELLKDLAVIRKYDQIITGKDLKNDKTHKAELVVYRPNVFHYQCSDCQHIYPYESILHSDWRTRVKDGDYLCHHCDRSFRKAIYGDHDW